MASGDGNSTPGFDHGQATPVHSGPVVHGTLLFFSGFMTLVSVGLVLLVHHAINYMLFGVPVEFPWTLIDLAATFIFFNWLCLSRGKPEIFRKEE